NRGLQIGQGVPVAELAERMAACDVHLLPCEGGAWELTVLETGACGVPNVITDYAGPPEYAAPFSLLVPVGAYLTQRRGDLRGIIDEERAVAALSQLASSPRLRRRLGRSGVRVAASYSCEQVGETWQRVLGAIDLSGRVSGAGLS